MSRTPQCFACHKFAKLEECVLMRHKKSGNRRWFHKRAPGARDCAGLWAKDEYWEEVDPALGETTEEEARRNAGLDN